MTPNIERRFVSAHELRVSDGAVPKIEGYSARFNSRSENLGGFVEIIQPGAFANAIKRSDIRALWNHDPSEVLGRVKAGTLEVREDAKGLWISNTPPSWAARHVETIKRGDVDQMSFGFRVAKGGATWTEADKDGLMLRTITEVEELLDVSPVTYPAYPDTSVAVRSLAEWVEGRPDWKAKLETLQRIHKQIEARGR